MPYFDAFAKKPKKRFPSKFENRDIELVRVAWLLGCYEAQKANVRFKISSFEIWSRQDFVC